MDPTSLRWTAASLAGLLTALSASAQNYPTRHITLVVPYAAGGSVDAVARMVAPKLGERLGQTIVIDNLAGAGGVIGTQKVAKAAPDGYTLLFSVESTMAIAKLVTPATVQYDGQRDFAPVSLVGTSPLVLVGRPTLGPTNIDELLKLMRAQPGKLNYATSGIGTSLHLAGEMINLQGKVSMTHVPYKVGAQITTDLLGNQIDLAVLPLVMALPNYKSGKIKAYGSTEATRSPVAPDLPSLAEHPALKGVDVTVWFGLFAPAKTDPAIVGKLHRELVEVLKQPDVRARMTDTGVRVVGSTPAEFAAFLAQEVQKFSAIVKAANIKAE